MATRVPGRIAAPLVFSLGMGGNRKSAVEVSSIGAVISVSKPRFRSSSSSSGSPSSTTKTERKIDRKMADRLSAVMDAVNDRKLPPELRGQRNAVRSETDIINVVEQRIWQSMEEGHFENLPGKGKPLDLGTNPHADPAEDTLYRILSKNGCAPEWVELNKEIRSQVAEWRLALKKAWTNKRNGDETKWVECSEALKIQIRGINDKVFRYNLIVPFGRQMFGLKYFPLPLPRIAEERETLTGNGLLLMQEHFVVVCKNPSMILVGDACKPRCPSKELWERLAFRRLPRLYRRRHLLEYGIIAFPVRHRRV
ncbi:hypothetical protein Nepgr_011713 [Nepenthes gracilis]|uniref:DnaJ homologue subfamily C member 28 conserved domain-containing protein n=1 Tax=Nepenthes gracilis TaxID=150966 RepID=A0AAD3SFZ4_NEPGR|nr:hypothetical protein Nepgr_011713 [Nepenthes gracilis]